MLIKSFAAPPMQVGNGQATFWITRRGIDECGDDVDPDGVDLSIFERNPVALWNHDTAHVIGRWSTPRRVGDGLQATLSLAGTPHAQEKRQLLETGFIRAASIGFNPVEAIPLDPSRPRGGQLYKRWVLLEVSLVAIPANTNATLIDFQDKSHKTEHNAMNREQRLAYVRALAAGVDPRPAPQLTPTQYLNYSGAKTRSAQVRAEQLHASAVMTLQKAANPTVEDRLAQVGWLDAPHRLHGLAGFIEEKESQDRATRKATAPESPAWTRGF